MISNNKQSLTNPPQLISHPYSDGISRQQLITPYNGREKTNLLCIVPYVILTTIVIATFFCAYVLERDQNMFVPMDPDGRKCGRDKAIGYSMIYFPTPFPETISRSVCVKQCPKSSQDTVNCLTNSKVLSCSFDITDHFNRTNQFIFYPTTTNSFLSLCQPSSKIIFDAINSKINTYQLFKNFSSIYESIYVIIVVCPFISILMVVIYVFLITQIKNTTQVFKSIIFCFGLTLFIFALYSFTSSAKKIFIYMPYVGIGFAVIGILYAFYFIYYRDYMHQSLELLDMGVQYIRQNYSLIFISLGYFLVWVIIFILQLIAIVFIYSINSQQDLSSGQVKFAYFAGIENTLIINIILILTIIHYVWTNLILYQCGKYIYISAGAFWVLGIQHNFKNALFSLLRFHLGTVIYGSLANPILGLMSEFFYLIIPQKDKSCCFCFYCTKLARFYESKTFSNHIGIYNDLNYIQVALKGLGYIEAGQSLSRLLIHNIWNIYRAYRVALTIVIISKILAALITTIICYIVILIDPNTKSDLLINIIIFIFSLILVSFAFESYNRSFEIILITILIKYNGTTSKEKFRASCIIFEKVKDAIESLSESEIKRNQLQGKLLQWISKQKDNQNKNSDLQSPQAINKGRISRK